MNPAYVGPWRGKWLGALATIALPISATLPVAMGVIGCAPVATATELSPQQEIRLRIDEGLRAMRQGNFVEFLNRVPEDFILERPDGSRSGKPELAAALARRAAAPPQTLRLEVRIERIAVSSADDRAEVWTFQQWERIAPAGTRFAGRRVLTTQRHHEWWRIREGLWEAHRIRELGGDMFVDGVRQ